MINVLGYFTVTEMSCFIDADKRTFFARPVVKHVYQTREEFGLNNLGDRCETDTHSGSDTPTVR